MQKSETGGTCEPQAAAAVLMVRPSCFAFNPQTAESNAFQQRAGRAAPADAQALGLAEFDALAGALERASVGVIVAQDCPTPAKPDALFPNNWVSFHHDGSAVLYPMLAPNRRVERRQEIIRLIVDGGGFRVLRTVDLSGSEHAGKFLEGTGSLVLDRTHRVAYASLSPRTHPDVLGEFGRQLDYELVAFDSRDAAGRAIYHTNVLMAIGAQFAVICGAAVAAARDRDKVFERLQSSGHEVIDITPAQMLAFAGNLLALAPPDGPLIAMSTTAWRSFDASQRRALERHGRILAADIPAIEHFGGGGVRCMLAEIHLPRAEPPEDHLVS